MTDIEGTDPRQTTIPGAEGRRGRGRPKGSKNKRAVAVDSDAVTATGAPRWSHDFFPIHDATPEQLAKWDKKDGSLGPPVHITIERKLANGKFEEITYRFDPDQIDNERLARLFGGGVYRFRAWHTYPKPDGEPGLICSRLTEKPKAGKPKPIGPALAGLLAESEEEAEEDEEEEDEEEEDEEEEESGAMAGLAATFRDMMKQQNDAHARELGRITELFSVKSTLETQAANRQRENDQAFYKAMLEMTKQQHAPPPPPPPPPDPIEGLTKLTTVVTLMGHLKKSLGGDDKPGAAIDPEVKDLIKELGGKAFGMVGEMWMATEDRKARETAIKAGQPDPGSAMEGGGEEEEEEEEAPADAAGEQVAA